MGVLVDCRFAALRALGHTGSLSDMMLQWLLSNGATTPTITDAWQEMLDIIQPGPPTSRSDQWHQWLFINGWGAPDKHVNDMETDFWCAGGLLVPKPLEETSFSSDFSLAFPGGV